MKYLIQLTRFASVLLFSLFFISESYAQAVGEIRSKNVELICPVQSPIKEEYIRLEKAVVTISSVDINKTIIPTPQGVDGLRIVDVTNPRSIIQEALRIKVKKTGSSSSFINFMNAEIWKDNTSGDAPHGHTFVIVELEEPSEALIEDNQTPTPDVFARFLIFDVTRAMETVSSSSTKTIIVDNPNSRQAHIDGNSTTYFDDVYVGYIDADNSLKSHTLRMEPEFGMMITSQSSDKIDLQHIAPIVSSDNITDPGASHNQFAIPTRITTTFNSQTLQPIPCDPNTSNSAVGKSHETVGEKLTSTKIRLYSALFGDRFIINGTTTDNSPDEGVLVLDVDFTSSTTNASVTHKDHWKYDADRTNPTRKTSTISGFAVSNTHTVIPKRYNSNSYLITANELASPRAARDIDGNAFDDAFQNIEITSDPTLSTNTFTGFSQGRKYSGSNEDYRLHGNYLKIWKFNESNVEVEGYGSNDGPIGSYDVPEQSVSDMTNGNFNPVLSPSGISSVQALATANSTDRQRGVNTVHHLRSIDNDEDIYVSWYSQGARVISIEDFPSNPVVKEKAFFDFYPTLTYDFKDNPSFSESNHYFSMNGTHISSGVGQGFYKNFIPAGLENYFMGVFDLMPDYGRIGLESDEKFMYASAIGEGKIPGETVDRNYLHGGGFFILRYFDDKIGGTITGYTGTNSTFDRSFRDVNLQGIFEVSRDVTVATGATVNLLMDTKLNPDASPGECLIIDGTVNVQTLAAEFTSTTGRGIIDVPVLVRNGGKLVIKSGAVIDFTKKVTVNLGGELTIENGAKVVFANPSNVCNGKFLVNGTITSRVKIHAALNTARTSTVGNSFFTMKGNPAQLSLSKLQIKFADVENVCFDAVDIKPGTPEMITQSTFSAHTTSPLKPYLVSYKRKFYANVLDAITPVKVTFSTFKDRNRACLDYEESHSGRYESCINQSHGFHGIAFTNVNFGEISNSNFTHLATSAYLDKGIIMNVKSCTLSYSNNGIMNVSNAMILCGNVFHGVGQGYQAITSLASFVYDNKIFKSRISSLNISGSSHFYRGNRFEDYSTGIFGWNSSLQLRDHVNNDVWNKLGRNQFLTTDPALIESADSIPAYGIYGSLVNDIHLANSQLLIHCGYNYFSQFSALHVFTGGVGTFNPGYNQWDDIGGSIVRTDANVAGTPLNTSQTVGASCNRVDINPPCPISVCAQGIYIVEYIGQDSFV